MNRTLALIISLVLGAGAALAEIPGTITFQGILQEAEGTGVTDGTYAISFRLYDSGVDGTVLWTSAAKMVEVVDSAFTTVLGADVPLDLPFDGPYWLSMAIDPDPELTPRLPLSSVPYARRAESADQLGDLTAAAFADTAHGHDAAQILTGVIDIDRLPVGMGGDQVASGAHMHFLEELMDVETGGFVEESMVLTYNGYEWVPEYAQSGEADSDWGIIPDVLYVLGGRSVGIGTTTPQADLDVRGDVQFGDDTLGGGVDLTLINGNSNGRLIFNSAKDAFRAGLQPSATPWDDPDNLGTQSIAMGIASNATGLRGIAIGQSALAGGGSSLALGYNAETSGTYGVAIGHDVHADSTNSMVIGYGRGITQKLINSTPNSLVVGFYTETPALFVGPGPTNRVGIGTTTPQADLDVDGTLQTSALKLPTGAANGFTLVSDSDGDTSWRDAGTVEIKRGWGSTSSTLGTSLEIIDSINVTVLGEADVLVESTVRIKRDHIAASDTLILAHNVESTSIGSATWEHVIEVIPADFPTYTGLQRNYVVASHHSFASAGTYTIYLLGRASGAGTVTVKTHSTRLVARGWR